MDVPFCAAIVPIHTVSRTAMTDIEARRDLLAAEARETPRLHRNIGKPNRFPEPHCDADPRQRRPAGANWKVRIFSVGTIGRHDRQPADREREQARPEAVGYRVDELARTFPGGALNRSEEQQSEIPALMRLSCDV